MCNREIYSICTQNKIYDVMKNRNLNYASALSAFPQFINDTSPAHVRLNSSKKTSHTSNRTDISKTCPFRQSILSTSLQIFCTSIRYGKKTDVRAALTFGMRVIINEKRGRRKALATPAVRGPVPQIMYLGFCLAPVRIGVSHRGKLISSNDEQ